ncbi:putative flavin-containing polyamine oxidase [Talaromyces proteolyticus]|uniref:Amine oxidase n=1 Tax=Talaromyces proteolyticus TaxID=1131652 RepID=A0AAD4KIS2_9EURO|nr:putative flavin-containing polyamine oxidase [Talaromyces proteolyticus]KAH8690275.1 putative flavin-containing polyamine oxidase [Talaromyces proteolyticus]
MLYKIITVAALLNAVSVLGSPVSNGQDQTCKKTKVAILGGGVAGITAAQSLSNNSVEDFIILEYNSEIGGRMRHTTFGKDADGKPLTVEIGANWIQGLGTPGGPQNPIWLLAQKYGVNNTYSNYSSILTYDETGFNDYSSLFNDYQNAYSTMEQLAGTVLKENLQDRSTRAGLTRSGWKPKKDKKAQAIEWWQWDFEYAYEPDISSLVYGIVNYNTSFYQWSNVNNFVWDQRGFNTWLNGEASTFLKKNDSRLRLNTVVTNVTYSDTGVTVTDSHGDCVQADYAICTFSVGVLQNDAVSFEPEFPDWKQDGIEVFDMGTYTKIFLQFPPDKVFWPKDTQYFLYADPTERGWYPVFQSLDTPGFLEGSGIIFVTVVHDQSYRAESQSDEKTKEEVMTVLRDMYGAENVPDPIAFMYPRWSLEPWAYGSYSNWPYGVTLEMHQNLRANVGRLYFAGEATSTEYFGFLQGAWYEGQGVGKVVAACVNNAKSPACVQETHYEPLHGSTPTSEYSFQNGWTVTSFQTNGV